MLRQLSATGPWGRPPGGGCSDRLLGEADIFHVKAQRGRDRRTDDVLVHQVVERLIVRKDERRIAGHDRADLPVEVLARRLVTARGSLVDQRVDRRVRIADGVDRAARLDDQ